MTNILLTNNHAKEYKSKHLFLIWFDDKLRILDFIKSQKY